MVTIGSLTWVAKVENAGRAQSKANEVAESMQNADEKANGLNTSLGRTGERLGTGADKARRMGTRMTTLTGVLGLVTSALYFLGGGLASIITYFSSASTVTGALAGALSTVAGWVTTAAGAIAGSATAIYALAAAAGVIIGLFGVWILEITGVLDWVRNLGQAVGVKLPGWARDGLLVLISIFSGALAAIGGFIVGFVNGFMEGGLVAGINRGVARAQQVLSIFSGAWRRTIQRIGVWIDKGVAWIMSLPKKATTAASRLRTTLTSTFRGMGRAIGSAFEDSFNAIIPNRLSIPEVQIGGGSVAGRQIPSVTIGGGSINLPQLQTGGFIEEAGAAVLHAGERVLSPAEVNRTTDKGKPTATQGGGGGGVTIETLQVDIGDQSLDLSNLTRADKEELARMIAEETGGQVEQIIGGQL